MRALGVIAGLLLAGCANPYAGNPYATGVSYAPAQPAPPIYPPLVPYSTLPAPLPTPDPPILAAPATPEDDGTPAVLLQPLPPSDDTTPVAATTEPAPTAPLAVKKPDPDGAGNVPLMGFRPMRGQKAPGA